MWKKTLIEQKQLSNQNECNKVKDICQEVIKKKQNKYFGTQNLKRF